MDDGNIRLTLRIYATSWTVYNVGIFLSFDFLLRWDFADGQHNARKTLKEKWGNVVTVEDRVDGTEV